MAPLHDEEAVVDALVERIVAAAARVTPDFEVVLVDDASRDGTGELLRAHAARDARVRPLTLARNLGQLGATLAGLAACRAPRIVVLDGDLQDPPELIPALLAAAPGPDDVAFAVKESRDDPGWFMVAQAAFHALQARLGGVPPGAGSYCTLPRALAARAASLPLPDANLAHVLAALGARGAAVPYAKAARAAGSSRVGAAGLVREAAGSLLLTGAAERGLALLAVTAALPAVLPVTPPGARVASVAVSAALGAVAARARARRHRILGGP